MTSSQWLVGLAIISLTAMGLTAMAGSIMMANPPSWFQSIAVSCLTNLALLIPSPFQKQIQATPFQASPPITK